jgi:hypothetical protein
VVGHAAIAHNELGTPLQDGLDQTGDVGRLVLVVGIGIHNDVSAQSDSSLETGHESGGQPAMLAANDMVHAHGSRHF